MRWQGRRQSTNIEDRRRMGGSGVAIGGAGGLGVVAVVLIGMFLGVDLTPLLGGQGAAVQTQSGPRDLSAEEQEAGAFVSTVLASTEDVWADVFPAQLGQTYQAPVLVLFSGATQSSCGGASAATGPFYCPADQRVYLDTQFFAVMRDQLGAGGDFAAAYVVAHEVGHHVQNLLGILDESRRGAQAGADSASVRAELQADCLAGLWAFHAQDGSGFIEEGDIAEAVNAAAQIGDDTLQREAGGAVRPDSFTHGTSEQRQRWFLRGFQSGDLRQCDTFRARQL